MRRSHQNYQTTAFERRDAGPAEALRSTIGRVGGLQENHRPLREGGSIGPWRSRLTTVRRVTPDRSGGSRRICSQWLGWICRPDTCSFQGLQCTASGVALTCRPRLRVVVWSGRPLLPWARPPGYHLVTSPLGQAPSEAHTCTLTV